jgi:hypothetical protein
MEIDIEKPHTTPLGAERVRRSLRMLLPNRKWEDLR